MRRIAACRCKIAHGAGDQMRQVVLRAVQAMRGCQNAHGSNQTGLAAGRLAAARHCGGSFGLALSGAVVHLLVVIRVGL